MAAAVVCVALLGGAPVDLLEGVPEPDRPPELTREAQELLPRLDASVRRHLEHVAQTLLLERSLRVQQGLLRDDLLWRKSDLNAHQLDVMVFVAIALSLDRAESETAILERRLEAGWDPDAGPRLEKVQQYRMDAETLLQELASRLEGIPERELRFEF